MSEDKAGKANASDAPDAPDAPDAIERLLGESLGEPDLAKGLVERVMSALPPREAMRPVLHPALRAAYGVTAVVFAFAAWSIDLPARLGAGGTAGRVALGAFFFQAAIGAAGLGLALLRDVGPAASKTLRTMFEGPKARALVATAGAIVLLLSVWGFLGWFPPGLVSEGVKATRASAVVLIFVLVAAAALQLWIMAKGRDWRPALRLVEAGGLVLAGAACAINYVIFVVV
ncbi:MAG: hypothetical protein ACYSU0_07840 [Planctomycetota bacterium]|jgi:hypothetical protein